MIILLTIRHWTLKQSDLCIRVSSNLRAAIWRDNWAMYILINLHKLRAKATSWETSKPACLVETTNGTWATWTRGDKMANSYSVKYFRQLGCVRVCVHSCVLCVHMLALIFLFVSFVFYFCWRIWKWTKKYFFLCWIQVFWITITSCYLVVADKIMRNLIWHWFRISWKWVQGHLISGGIPHSEASQVTTLITAPDAELQLP